MTREYVKSRPHSLSFSLTPGPTAALIHLVADGPAVLTIPDAASQSARLLATQYNALEHKRQNNAITP